MIRGTQGADVTKVGMMVEEVIQDGGSEVAHSGVVVVELVSGASTGD